MGGTLARIYGWSPRQAISSLTCDAQSKKDRNASL
jgi:hypothetical protein